MKVLISIFLAIFLVLLLGSRWFNQSPGFSEACIDNDSGIAVCAASNMARFSRDERLILEHNDFNLTENQNIVRLHAARNETVAFQLVLRRTSSRAPTQVSVSLGQWGNDQRIDTQLFMAHYHWVDKGGYQWGPKTKVREWPAAYPDALLPQVHGCNETQQALFDAIVLPDDKHQNQAIWIESYVPHTVLPGIHSLPIELTMGKQTITLQLQLTVYDVSLPDIPSIDAIGEVYRSYALEGAGVNRHSESWKQMAHCYQQLAHRHRMVFIERTPSLPDSASWQHYIDTYHPVLNGDLFTASKGYTGTGEGKPVTIWRTPWPQELNVLVESPLGKADFTRYETLAEEWQSVVASQQWNNTKFFAYAFDEVDGPDKSGMPEREYRAYIQSVHEQMGQLQEALDSGAGTALDLLWTSHSNPESWADDPELDLRGKVRLWSPNASAASPAFLAERASEGEDTWFYHSGHPAVGAHSINAYGVDMRTWGVIGARYGIKGQFMWAVNLGSDERPFKEPSYKPDDDRFGNGVLVYPGNQLDKIGFEPTPGPLPSMRLKTWRRGLQDAEIFLLAYDQHPEKAAALIERIMPVALADATGDAAWSLFPSDWINFKQALLTLAQSEHRDSTAN